MNVLFICRSNFARSQIAQEIFNSLSHKHTSQSAGIKVEKQLINKPVGKIGKNLVLCMKKIGIDISNNKPKKLKMKFSKDSDLIISLIPKEKLPKYILSKKVLYWQIPDPKKKDLNFYIKIREEINKKILLLLKDIQNNPEQLTSNYYQDQSEINLQKKINSKEIKIPYKEIKNKDITKIFKLENSFI